MVMLVLIIVGLSLSVIMIHNSMKADAHVINLAGKQRMIIQKMTKEAFMINAGHEDVRKNLKETSELFDKTLNGLIYGSEELNLPPALMKSDLNFLK